MTNEKLEIYKCNLCGNVVQVLVNGGGQLICCNQEMELQNIQIQDSEMGEKHSPKLEEIDNKKIIGIKKHPMNNEHYIQFIETVSTDKNDVYIKFFNPEEVAEADITFMEKNNYSVGYCNLHKLWGEKKHD